MCVLRFFSLLNCNFFSRVRFDCRCHRRRCRHCACVQTKATRACSARSTWTPSRTWRTPARRPRAQSGSRGGRGPGNRSPRKRRRNGRRVQESHKSWQGYERTREANEPKWSMSSQANIKLIALVDSPLGPVQIQYRGVSFWHFFVSVYRVSDTPVPHPTPLPPLGGRKEQKKDKHKRKLCDGNGIAMRIRLRVCVKIKNPHPQWARTGAYSLYSFDPTPPSSWGKKRTKKTLTENRGSWRDGTRKLSV